MSFPYLVVEASGPNDCYVGTVRGIQQNGDIVVSREMETKEIRPAMFIFNRPKERFLTCPGRNIHPFFQVLESIWILGGRGDVKWISKYLKNMEKYSDGKEEFHAPYGIRMREYGSNRNHGLFVIEPIDQFQNCYDYLSSDPETRHAVMSFWNPHFDHIDINTIDRPCNITFHFLIRNGKLDLTIFNRSNDVHWGLFNANVVQFSVILESMAMLLGIPVGKQIHMIDSLHYYTDNPLTKEILDNNKEESRFNVYEYVNPHHFGLRNEAGVDNWSLFNGCLDDFFRDEKLIREGKLNDASLYNDFSYLRDALYVARSFYFYKRKDYILAIDDICRVKANDIYVTCCEYLARDIDDTSLDSHFGLEERFSPKHHVVIADYILGHRGLG